MKICLLEPFHTGSHAAWAEEFARHSRHQVSLLTLPGRRWKWRMHGGAVTLARQFIESGQQPDLLLASDMLDLTSFLALTRKQTAHLPCALYFHENQLTYPWSENGAGKDRQLPHYAFINFTSALSADAVLFNSHYHQQSFLTALPEFLKKFPDHNELQSVEQIRAKSCVLHLGQELKRFDDYRPTDATAESQRPPLILWNHRWEYDKNPQAFFEALYQLQDEGLNFEVALLGESFRNGSAVFDQARERLGERVVQFGYAESFADYARWLWRADLLPVTSDHDFFGGSVVQAIYCGCTPLLPRRLAYPEHLPPELAESCLFDDYNELTMQLRSLLQGAKRPDAAQLRAHVSRYDWQELIGQYDDLLEGLVG